jgi:hypothetical protein
VRRCASDNGINQSRHSRRTVPMTRSQSAFAFGLAIGDRNVSTPKALIESSRLSSANIHVADILPLSDCARRSDLA